MANKEEYERAFGNVSSGHAKKRDVELTEKAAKQAGSQGSRARDAQKKGAKK